MYRLLKKLPNNLKDLPTGFSTREEFASLMLLDQSSFMRIKNSTPTDISAGSVDELIKLIFTKSGWQLTQFGCSALMRSYNWFSVDNIDYNYMTGKILLNFGQIIKGPWYAANTRLILWDQSIYFEVQMFDKNIKKYVDFYVPKPGV